MCSNVIGRTRKRNQEASSSCPSPTDSEYSHAEQVYRDYNVIRLKIRLVVWLSSRNLTNIFRWFFENTCRGCSCYFCWETFNRSGWRLNALLKGTSLIRGNRDQDKAASLTSTRLLPRGHVHRSNEAQVFALCIHSSSHPPALGDIWFGESIAHTH